MNRSIRPAHLGRRALPVRVAMLLALLLAAPVAFAQTTETAAPPLTDRVVSRFADSMIELATWAHEKNEAWKEKWQDDSGSEGAQAILSALDEQFDRSAELVAEADGIVRRHGFESREAWTAISERIMTAYAAIKVAESDNSVEKGVASMLERLSASGLSEEQKAEMRKAFEEAQRRMDEFQDTIPKGDREAVQRNLSLLDSTFERVQSIG